MKKSSFILALSLSLMGLFTACDKNKGDFTITFISPTDGMTVGNAAAVVVEVKFDSPKELEKLELSLKVDSTGAPEIAPFPIEGHDHVKTKTMMQNVDLSGYPSGTAFRLTAKSCKDHTCSQSVTSSVRFLIP